MFVLKHCLRCMPITMTVTVTVTVTTTAQQIKVLFFVSKLSFFLLNIVECRPCSAARVSGSFRMANN